MLHAYELELQSCPYSKASLCNASLCPELVTWLETACDAIVRSSQPQRIAVPQSYAAYFSTVLSQASLSSRRSKTSRSSTESSSPETPPSFSPPETP